MWLGSYARGVSEGCSTLLQGLICFKDFLPGTTGVYAGLREKN